MAKNRWINLGTDEAMRLTQETESSGNYTTDDITFSKSRDYGPDVIKQLLVHVQLERDWRFPTQEGTSAAQAVRAEQRESNGLGS